MNHANGNKATAGNVPKITKLYKIVMASKQTLALNFSTGLNVNFINVVKLQSQSTNSLFPFSK